MTAVDEVRTKAAGLRTGSEHRLARLILAASTIAVLVLVFRLITNFGSPRFLGKFGLADPFDRAGRGLNHQPDLQLAVHRLFESDHGRHRLGHPTIGVHPQVVPVVLLPAGHRTGPVVDQGTVRRSAGPGQRCANRSYRSLGGVLRHAGIDERVGAHLCRNRHSAGIRPGATSRWPGLCAQNWTP